MESLTFIVFILTVLATAVMAASAAIQAVRQEFDLFGAIVLSIVTAVGGGTVRDILIGAMPVFWLKDITYLATAVPVSAVAFCLWRYVFPDMRRRLELLLYLDAIGLALFTLVGIQVSLLAGLDSVYAIVLGCITGIVGGMLRDILSGMQPTVLKKDLYATISLAGGTLYLLLVDYLNEEISLSIAFIAMVAVRFLVIFKGRRL
ncbi:MAG: TRIC cation channel family protein [Pseudomonadota bacterium]